MKVQISPPVTGAASESDVSVAEGVFGQVVRRSMEAGPYHILYSFYNIREKCRLDYTGREPALRVIAAMKGDCHLVIDSFGDVYLRQGQFIISYSPSSTTTVVFDQRSDLLLLNMYFPVDDIQLLSAFFPLQTFLGEIQQGRPATLFSRPGWLTLEILREISYTLGATEERPLREYFFSIKIKELLHLLFMQKFYTGKEPVSEDMLECIRETRHIIETRVGEPLSMARIASLVHMNINDLKKYFRLVVGMDLQAFIVYARLSNARLLLQQTDLPIREVAHIAGYEHERSFAQAFRKCFEYTPSFVRRW